MPTESNVAISEVVIDARGAATGAAQVVTAFESMGRAEQVVLESTMRFSASMPQSLSRVEAAIRRLESSLDPVTKATYRAQDQMTRQMQLMEAGVLKGVRTQEEADRTLHRLRESQIADIERVRQAQMKLEAPSTAVSPSMHAVNDNAAQFRRQNLGYQLQDVGVSLYGGMPITTVLLQQGSQIAGIYSGQGGVNQALKDFGGLLGTALRYAAPFAAAGAAIYGSYRLVASYGVEAAAAVDDATRAMAGQAAPMGTLQGMISELSTLQTTYQENILATGAASDKATSLILSNTEREFKAKQSLLGLELKLQEAKLATMRADAEVASIQLRREVSDQVFTRSDLEARGFADARAGSVPFVRLPDDVSGLDKTQQVIEDSPLNRKITELRANLELTELGAERLREALKSTFNGRELIDKSGRPFDPMTPNGIPTPTARPNDIQRLDDEAETTRQRSRLSEQSKQRVAEMQLEINLIGNSTAANVSATFGCALFDTDEKDETQ